MNPSFLILTGDGINCERETLRAINLEGGEGQIVHINDLMKNRSLLNKFQGLVIPGGFSFGDDLGSGKILSLKIRVGLKDEFERFIESRRPILGICNGFQVLTKMGVLPSFGEKKVMALIHNKEGEFVNRWASLKVDSKSHCIWTKGLSSLDLPVRHGEGRIVFSRGDEDLIYNELLSRGQLPLFYEDDINGSYKKIAGVCDPTGLILGLMPHPEAAVSDLLSPSSSIKAKGSLFFNNAIEYIKNS